MLIPKLARLPGNVAHVAKSVDPLVEATNKGIVYADDGSAIVAERQQDGRVKLSFDVSKLPAAPSSKIPAPPSTAIMC
jgi:hypothetical protein